VLGVELLRRQVAREFPDAREGETMDRFRAWASARRHRGAPATATAPGRVGDLERLVALHDSGVLSDEEFASQKVLILDGK
jgi:hypothetical protein